MMDMESNRKSSMKPGNLEDADRKKRVGKITGCRPGKYFTIIVVT